jgi:protein-S-isoprenylcysteine O-methyltransferase Ste14
VRDVAGVRAMTMSIGHPKRAIVTSALRIVANVTVVLALGLLGAASYRQFTLTGSINSLGLLVLNVLFVIMYVTRRDAKTISTAPASWLLAFTGTTLPLLMRPTAPSELAAFGNTVQMFGICLIVVALFSLKRSFGVVPANRGIREGGLYRIVRHPLYAAELLALFGVLIANASVLNALLWTVQCILQCLRARAEEKFLSADTTYRAYRDRVRYRLIPGLI